MASLRHLLVAIWAAVICAALFFTAAVATADAAGACTQGAMYVAAHEDDTLLFQSPSILRDVQSGRCVRTVFLTAGDAGKTSPYWEGREVGAEAGYAAMAGVANQWTGSQIVANGHSLQLETLDGQPGISIVYMRLPDGGESGEGTALYGLQSLEKLWKGGTGGSPAISSIDAVDDSATYSYQGLIDTLAALMSSFEAPQVATQNYTQAFVGPDHPDHVGTAYFAKAAHQLYAGAHRLLGYQDYETSVAPQNVFGSLLEEKSAAFYAYGAHDSEACASAIQCTNTAYAKWLAREYIAATATVGVVANAGYMQEADPSAMVTLDGSQSSGESGNPLSYQWSQVGGPAVSLAGAATASPSFVTPSHPTLLTFSLTVKDGPTSSKPNLVKVKVPGPAQPVAVVSSGQAVASGATVGLDGSSSYDPNALPLQYAWTQIAGPAVGLNGAASEKPSFVAPTGPASLKFSLVVSNGEEASIPSTVTIAVAGTNAPVSVPPPGQGGPVVPSHSDVRLSSAKVKLRVGKASRRVVKVIAPAQSSVKCKGALPRGARCRVSGQRNVVIEGSKTVSRAGTYRLTIHVVSLAGAVQRPLVVVFRH
jgi:LmbE family N-acetylglucosaminyl deacetylase